MITKPVLLVIAAFFAICNILTAQTVAGGTSHSVFLCSDGTVQACGANGNGQLGNGTNTNDSNLVQVSSLTGITAIAASESQSFFLKSDGTVWAAGWNNKGQLGDGTILDRNIPVQVSSLSGITAVAAGYWHTLFLKNDGTVWACGDNAFGQLGDGTIIGKSTPVQVSSLTGITAISTGGSHSSLFLKNDGTVWACGRNGSGQLGDGTTTDQSTPVQVSTLTNIISIAGGGWDYSLFLKNDNTVWACGANNFGQLGDGTTIGKLSPIQVTSLTGITDMKGGGGHSLFLKNDNTVWVCGRNSSGQLGDGTIIDKATPFQLGSLSGITSFSTGTYHSLFQKNDGTVWGCGNNWLGKLGDGTTINRSTPVQSVGLCSATVITENYKENIISIYPNPTKGEFTLQSENNILRVELYNIIGEKVMDRKLASKTAQFNISHLTKGIYLVKILYEEGSTITKVILD